MPPSDDTSSQPPAQIKKKTTKDALVSLEEKIDLGNKDLVSIKTDISDIKDELINIKEVVIQNLIRENERLKERVEELEGRSKYAEDRLVTAEIHSYSLEQYDRRNNIEIQGIPNNIINEELEGKVIEIFKAIDIDITSYDIEDCHRLGHASPKTTIVRFVNRRNCKTALITRKKLKTANLEDIGLTSPIFLNENLSPNNSRLAFKCRQLKRAKLCTSTWSMNGMIYLHRTINEKPKKILHDCTLTELYPDFKFIENNSQLLYTN